MKSMLHKGARYSLLLLKELAAARTWLLCYVLLILLPASFLLYFYYERSSVILEKEVTRSMLQTMKQTGINLTYQFERVRDTSNSIFMNPNLYKYLDQSEATAPIGQQLVVLKDLRYMMDTAETNGNVFRVRLFVDKSRIYAGELINFFPMDSLKSRPWYNSVIEAGGSIVWVGAYQENYIDRGSAYVLSTARMIRNAQKFDQMTGVLVIDMTEQTVRTILDAVDLSKQQVIYMVDSAGVAVSHADQSLLGKPVLSADLRKSIIEMDEGIIKIAEGDDAKYAVFTTIQSTGWKLVAEVPAAEISRQAVTLNRFSSVATLLGVSIMFLLLVFVLLAFIIRGMNRRVQLVIRTIHKEGLESLDDRNAASDGHINVLERSVDHLIDKVRNLMEETYKTKVLEREAQLRALQAQINPHFLYNTLDTINWIAIGRNAHDISQMIDALAKYFRLSLNKGRDNVSVEDELNLAKVYLEIQQSRFPESFEFTVESDPAIHKHYMPKLTLQPIVENALLHGIRKSKAKSGHIRIAAHQDGEELVLSVSDDGAGMEEEIARKLLSEPRPESSFDSAGSSYGLYNVNERIRLYSGEGYGLSIRSAPEQGTTVTVRLQIIREEQVS
ncbi:sensor histidine kinase [Paenibacillus radicis (ex Xue et al. 2023)]|uniref:histidine kinase n=1 Tax=Paenibacillus radicis (ex Xue et al. 2023) TaxID=2972489 RepID=A0ABT1YEH5_9BACL|nr:sensor histidine kinase [Paenibacillus radicis (ex Xue et al. 2023)]MCR8631579.1 sensor histidine kinase [Paenibacillus radicis (ex Xue et al. 2023)]